MQVPTLLLHPHPRPIVLCLQQQQKQQQDGSNCNSSDDEYVQHAGQKRSREQHRRQREPVLQEVSLLRPAGVQGFSWFTNSLKLDADGDAAHEFLVEEQQQQPSTTAAAVAAAHVQAPSQVRLIQTS